jgi:hypothetical protein
MNESENPILSIILCIILCIVLYIININEPFGSTTGGALTQLVAKDQQDTYLTGYNNNIDPVGGLYYPYFPFKSQLWNNPTKIRSYYWPYLYYDPTYYPWYYTYA